MKGNLTDLSVEILEHIVHQVDDSKDLLHFALTNKEFSQLIIERHLQFRIIRCLANTELIWSKLASRPRLCQNIRELHIYTPTLWVGWMHLFYPGNLILPPYLLNNDSDIQVLWPRGTQFNQKGEILNPSTKAMAAHSAGSPLATKQSWKICSPEQSVLSLYKFLPLAVNLTKITLIFPDNVSPLTWRSLKAVLDNLSRYSSSRLREFAFTWENSKEALLDDTFSSIWTLSDTLFHFKMRRPILDNHVIGRMFHLIVDRCPNLERLCLNFATFRMPTNLDEVWKRANWKHLRSLCLGWNMTLRDTEDGNLFRDFMACHPGLECLEYFGNDGAPLSDLLQANVLKNLRFLNLLDIPMELSSPPPPSSTVGNVPVPQVSVFEKVEYLSIAYSTGVLEKFYAPSLRMLIMTRNISNCEPEEGSGLFPETLERLCIKIGSISPSYNRIQAYLTKLLVKPSYFLKLTHLCISGEVASIILARPEKILQEISGLSPLKYFGLANPLDDRSEVWIRLIRDTCGEYAAYEIDNSIDTVSKWWNVSLYF